MQTPSTPPTQPDDECCLKGGVDLQQEQGLRKFKSSYLWWILIGLSCVVFLSLLSLSLVIPHIIQGVINKSNISINTCIISTLNDGLLLDLNLRFARALGSKVTLLPASIKLKTVEEEVHLEELLLLRREEDGSRRRLTDSPSFAALATPRVTLKGKSQNIEMSCPMSISDQSSYATFLQSFVTYGQVELNLQAELEVNLIGIQYGGMRLDKNLVLNGPILHIPEEAQGGAAPSVAVRSLDMTDSSDTVALLALEVDLLPQQKNETGPAITVDPLGRLTLAASFDGEQILTLETRDEAKLMPGTSTLHLLGVIPSLADVDSHRADAVRRLMQNLILGKTCDLTVRGLSTTVPLYDPAISYIHLQTPMKLDQQEGFSLVKRLIPVGIQLSFPSPSNTTWMRVVGQFNADVVNPFGPSAAIALPAGSLHGQLVSVKADTEEETLANFKGRLSSASGSSPILDPADGSYVWDKAGKLSYCVHTLPLELTLDLDLLNDAEPFRDMMLSMIRSSDAELQFRESFMDLTVDCLIGDLQLTEVPLHQSLKLGGLSGLKNIRTTGVDLSNFPFLDVVLNPSNAQGGKMGVNVELYSDSVVSMYLGTLRIQLKYQGRHLIYLQSVGCWLKPGVNQFSFTGGFKMAPDQSSGWVSLGATLLMGKSAMITVVFLDKIPDYYRDVVEVTSEVADLERFEPPAWLQSMLAGTVVETWITASMLSTSGLPNTLTQAISSAADRRSSRPARTNRPSRTRTIEGSSNEDTNDLPSIANAVQNAVQTTARIGAGLFSAISSSLQQQQSLTDG